MKTASFRLEEDQNKEIEKIAKKMKIDKSAAARKIIEIGIKEIRKNEALEKVLSHKWTVWKAASHCNESYRSFLQIMKIKNIPYPLSIEELKREFDEISSE